MAELTTLGEPVAELVHGGDAGASGARVLGRLANELRDRGGSLGVAALCIGVGQGLAVVLEGCD